MFGCFVCVKYTPKFFMGYKLSRKNVFVKVKMFFFYIYILFHLQIELLLLVTTKRRGCQQQIFLESFSFRSHIFLLHLLFSTTLNEHVYSAHFQYESVGIKICAGHSSAATLCDICKDNLCSIIKTLLQRSKPDYLSASSNPLS